MLLTLIIIWDRRHTLCILLTDCSYFCSIGLHNVPAEIIGPNYCSHFLGILLLELVIFLVLNLDLRPPRLRQSLWLMQSMKDIFYIQTLGLLYILSICILSPEYTRNTRISLSKFLSSWYQRIKFLFSCVLQNTSFISPSGPP